MDKNDTLLDQSSNWIKTSIIAKGLGITFIILILMIPTIRIHFLVKERSRRYEQAIAEVGSKWGAAQTISGPILTIPYIHTELVETNYSGNNTQNPYTAANRIVRTKRFAYFLPSDVRIQGTISPVERYRGIYKVLLYTTSVNVEGTFDYPDFERLGISESNILFEEAFLSIGIPDMRGLVKQVHVQWDDVELAAEPGLTTGAISSGLAVPVTLSGSENDYSFSFPLVINGSQALHFTPVGKQTNVTLTSEWPNPSFEGNFLPTEREISDKGFQAHWHVLHVNRNYPQQWIGDQYNNIEFHSSFGVNLLAPVNGYASVSRSTKYAILFIVLTFVCFLLVELLRKQRIHPVQYTLVGFALVLFYALLLSLSEHLGFNLSYFIASAGIILMITLYTLTVFRNYLFTGIIGGALAVLYGFLYSLLQMEDYALLMGSVALFIVLGAFMYLTRNIDWYNLNKRSTEKKV